ncbi:AAA family ATPase [Marimonas sp. MJW-29]|uniref:AAA family ATPase n=1 Tax=Sulfitobacter sediminis TaxID=3234186 RepID=A0ABV3RUR2_9RHOB
MTEQISEFLLALDLSQHVPAFVENDVEMDLLPSLSDADLRDLGVDKLGHRKRILAAAAALGSTEGPADGTSARAQRRLLTLMFADLVGSTALSTRLSLEAYRETIRDFQDTVSEGVESYGGFVAKFLGDGVLAYFGYPQSHEDDAERAIQAGLALVKQIGEFTAPNGAGRLELRVGIETGLAVVGEIVGRGAAQEYSALGSTPNLAARLQTVADPGAVVVGPACRRLSDGAAEFETLGPHVFKGFDDPVPVWRVVRFSGSYDRLERRQGDLAPLVGREHEIGALEAALSRTRLGALGTTHVIGEPGIGKSRLLREFIKRQGEAFTLLIGQCSPHAETTAFHLFIDLLRRFRDTVVAEGGSLEDRLVEAGLDRDRHIPYLRRLVEPHASIPGVDPDLIGSRTREALSEFMMMQGRLKPTVLYLNDLHWIDERSSNVLDALVRDPKRRGVLIVATFRPEFSAPWADAPGVEELVLEPLSTSEAVQLFREHLTDRGTLADMMPFIERAGGNPLFLEEIARHFTHEPSEGPVLDSSGIPETLAGLLMQRVDRLSPEARRLVERASVIGREFDTRLLGAGGVRHLAELDQSGIVQALPEQPDRFKFQHALVQQVIYESLLSEDRRSLHGDVARCLEDLHAGQEVEVAEFLAQHSEAAGNAIATARYALMAGNKALDLFALRDAQEWFQKCIDLTGPAGEVDDILLLARAVVNQTQILCWNGDFPAMTELARSHLARVQTLGEIEEVSRLLTWIGEGYMHATRYADAKQAFDRAQTIGEALGDESSVGYAKGLRLWLDSIVGEGETFDALPSRSKSVEVLGRHLGDRYLFTLSHYTRWAHATQVGQVGVAAEEASYLQAMGSRDNYPPAECWGACLLALSQAEAGNLKDAFAAAEHGVASAASGFDRLMADLALGMVLVAADDPSPGLARLSNAPWRTERIGAFYFAYAGDAAYGRGLVRGGQLEEGTAWLREGMRWFDTLGNRRGKCLSMLGLLEAAAKTGDATQARLWFERTTNEAARAGMRGVQAEAHLIVADVYERIGDLDVAMAENSAAKVLVQPLGWLALEQRLNAQARRLATKKRY